MFNSERKIAVILMITLYQLIIIRNELYARVTKLISDIRPIGYYFRSLVYYIRNEARSLHRGLSGRGG